MRAPRRSARIYLCLARPHTRLFRYLLEARDNLACISVVDRQACILKLTCAPGQLPALIRALEEIRSHTPWERINIP